MNTTTTISRDDGAKLALGLGLGWGVGSLAMALLWNTVNVLLLRYLTDFLGVAAAAASALIATSKIYDAVLNPAMGVISDRADTRWGRRRPFMLGGVLLCALALPLLFWLPSRLSPDVVLVSVGFGVLFYATAYTAFNVPYMAMPAEMGLAYHERSRLMTYRVAAIGFGQLAAGIAAPLLVGRFGGGAQGHATMSWVLAAVVLVTGLACVAATRSAPFTLRAEGAPSRSYAGQMRLTMRNRPFVMLMGTKLMQLLGVALHQAALAFFAAHALRTGHAAIATILTTGTITMLASLPVWLRISRRLGKVLTFQLGAVIYAAGTLTWLWTGAGTPTFVTIAIPAVTGIGSAAMLLIGQSLLPDTITYDRELTGQNREGALTGVYSMVEKIAFALGMTLAGAVLTYGGYTSGLGDATDRQSATAIAAVYTCFAMLPAFCSLGAAALLFFYRLERGPRGGVAVPAEDRTDGYAAAPAAGPAR
jgi:GPH family glycoside/pentoside/hexuronide:cation symporter